MTRKVVILGAGISGLAVAWYLKQKERAEVEIIVLEKSRRVGGWIQTVQSSGFLFEKGPRSCRTQGNGRITLELVEALGLQADLIRVDAAAQKRYIFHNEQLQALPASLWGLPFSILMKGWGGVFLRDLLTPAGKGGDESIYDFFCRRIGTAWTERLIDPLVAGIYAGDLRLLSIQSCFPELYELENRYGGLIKGRFQKKRRPSSSSSFIKSIEKSSAFSFKKGMETLPRALYQQLEADFLFESTVEKIESASDGVKIHLKGGKTIEADEVFSTLPLSNLYYATIAVVNLGYHQPVLKQHGFGYLIPTKESKAVLGTVFDSVVFPQQNQHIKETRLTCMLGGARYPHVADWTEECCLKTALEVLEQHLGINVKPDHASVSFTRQAIPQFEVGHRQKMMEFKQSHVNSRFKVLGSAFSGVAVNDCIKEAKTLVRDSQ